MNKMNTQEMISALVDGELDGDELAAALAVLSSDPQALQDWQAYHLVGDVLRSPDLAAGALSSSAFLDRFSSRLAAEPPLAPAGRAPAGPLAGASRAEPANDAMFRWKLAAGFASVAAAVSVGWALLGSAVPQPSAPQLAAVPAPAGAVMIRNPQLDELLAAHKQLGGSGALQMPASFVRQATFDAPAR